MSLTNALRWPLPYPSRSQRASLKAHPTDPHPFPSLTPYPHPYPRGPTSIPAGRRKNPPGDRSGGRIEGGSEIRREAKQSARRRSRRLAENLFYRRNRSSPSPNSADSFTEDELNAIGLGYDRYVRFLPKDDPSLRHPHDWYKYGRYGPYSWRGVVVGPPIRGRFSDDRVTLISEVQSHEEWEEIEQFDMSSDFDPRIREFDLENNELRYYWVFVRHPKWRASELPWQQWTLVCEVAVEAGKGERLDKWSLMGRFGNKTRALITQCAAWQRPDIIYVKKPVYQCRFEPQDSFFGTMVPLVDPATENNFLCELTLEDGRVEACTYFGGLCKIVKVNPKAYVDDVVKGYERLSDEGKERCLEFLLRNHPTELLHPYTKEWKAKLEELELGCDAPDGSDEDNWEEDEEEDDSEDDDDDDDGGGGGGEEEEEEVEDEEVDDKGSRMDPEETPEYWNEQWKKAMRSSGEMEKLVAKTMEVSDKYHEQQMMEEKEMEERDNAQMMEEKEMEERDKEGSGRFVDKNREQRQEAWESRGYKGPRQRLRKSRIPPELFLRAAVRPFTYRNLVKEIVLMRHAIVDGDIKRG